jgi:hypothetical protein
VIKHDGYRLIVRRDGDRGASTPSAIASELCMKNYLINTLVVVVSMAATYVLLEVGSTWFFGRSLEGSYFVYSGSRTLKFDPISGYRLTREITFMTRITRGVVEYFGFYKGNNRGFPGRDFTPERQDQRKRFAVFGDSFTHADYQTAASPGHEARALARSTP